MNRIGLALLGIALALASGRSMADVVAVVSVRSPIVALSRNQVIAIFLGSISRYPDGTRAIPLDQAEGSAVRDEFYSKLTQKSAAQLKAYWSKVIFAGRGQPPPTVANSIEMMRSLRDNPAAVGYIDSALVDDSVRVLF